MHCAWLGGASSIVVDSRTVHLLAPRAADQGLTFGTRGCMAAKDVLASIAYMFVLAVGEHGCFQAVPINWV